jgi:hypothetical protein
MHLKKESLLIFATGEQGTLAALQHAASIAKSSGIVIVVPRVVGYGAPMEPCDQAEADSIARSYMDLAGRVGLHASVRVVTARDARHVGGRMALEPSRILVGGRWRGWRATPEQQLGCELAADGHDVTFVDVETGQARSMGKVHA